MIRAMVVDDEVHARDELEALLQETGEFEIVGVCANAVEAVRVIRRTKPEVLFLDVEMPGLTGFQLLSLIDEEDTPHVVFVTAYDEYALQAFEEKTLDYLLKPVDRERLAKTVGKIRQALRSGVRPEFDLPELQRIPCLRASRIKLISPSDVVFVRSDPAGVYAVTAEGEFFTDLSLKVLETRTALVRCHKQFLVNLDHVDEIDIEEGGAGRITTKQGLRLPVSRRYLRSLRANLGF